MHHERLAEGEGRGYIVWTAVQDVVERVLTGGPLVVLVVFDVELERHLGHAFGDATDAGADGGDLQGVGDGDGLAAFALPKLQDFSGQVGNGDALLGEGAGKDPHYSPPLMAINRPTTRHSRPPTMYPAGA